MLVVVVRKLYYIMMKPTKPIFFILVPILVATAEDSDSPVAMKLKKMWLKTPVSEEQAAQAVLDPAIGNY